MTPRLGSLKPKEVIRRLKRLGFGFHHQTGSHVFLRDARGVLVTVPYHAREMKRGLLLSLLKQARISPEEFADL